MVDPSKLSLIVKINKPTHVLHGCVLQKNSSCSSKTLKLILYLILSAIFASCLAAGLFFGIYASYDKLRYQIDYPEKRFCGTMEFEEYHATTSFSTRDVTTMTDGRANITAVKINTTTSGLPSFTCLIRYGNEVGIELPSDLPEFGELSLYLEDTTSGPNLEIELDDNTWTSDVFSAVDFNSLPSSIQTLCYNSLLFKMIPKNDGNIVDDSVLKKRISDQENTNDDRENTDHEQYETTTLDSPKNKTKKNLKDSLFTAFQQSHQRNNLNLKKTVGRRKRQAKLQSRFNEKKRLLKTKTLKMGKHNKSFELPSSVRCCQTCATTHLRCSRVCVPMQQLNYPNFFISCKFTQCDILLPCSLWRKQALGNV